MAMVAGIDAADDVAFADVAGKTFLIADALPRFEADKRTTGFVGGPDAIGISIEAIHAQYRITLFVEESDLGNFLLAISVFIIKASWAKVSAVMGNSLGRWTSPSARGTRFPSSNSEVSTGLTTRLSLR